MTFFINKNDSSFLCEKWLLDFDCNNHLNPLYSFDSQHILVPKMINLVVGNIILQYKLDNVYRR